MVGDGWGVAAQGAAARNAAARVRLVCVDLDGTLLGPDKRVSAGNQAALARAREAGLTVAIASGRHPFNVCDLADELGLPHTAVCLSGALAMLGGREVHRHPMAASDVEAAIGIAERRGLYLSVSGADFNLTAGAITRVGGESAATRRYLRCASYDELRCEAEARPGQLLKVALHAETDDGYAAVRAELAQLPGVTCAQSDVRWVDVTARGCSKLGGIRALAEALGLTLAQVAAIGDDENDVESVGAVGFGVAMGNAIGPVREAAALTVADNGHDGVAEALDLIVRAREGSAR